MGMKMVGRPESDQHFVCVLSGNGVSTTVTVSIQSEKAVVKAIDAKSTSQNTCF